MVFDDEIGVLKTLNRYGGIVDLEGEPARDRRPMTFREVYLGQVSVDDFRRNARGELGTRTATLHRHGIEKLRQNWVYKL